MYFCVYVYMHVYLCISPVVCLYLFASFLIHSFLPLFLAPTSFHFFISLHCTLYSRHQIHSLVLSPPLFILQHLLNTHFPISLLFFAFVYIIFILLLFCLILFNFGSFSHYILIIFDLSFFYLFTYFVIFAFTYRLFIVYLFSP